ncbi:MAG: hypothetical protein IJH99_10770 [Eubacterium sp.]|nr:hypothetical protein [Eubacterium sp.]
MKKAFSTVSVAVIVFSLLLSGCGSGSKSSSGTQQNSAAEEPAVQPDETSSQAEDSEQTVSETQEITGPVYTVNTDDPAVILERVRTWDETLNEYDGAPVGKRVLMREEYFKGPEEAHDGHYCYACDRLGNERVHAYYSDDYSLFGYSITLYDENNYKIRQTDYNSSGENRQQVDYFNNEDGIAVREQYYSNGESVSDDWDEYEVDEAGNRVKRYGYRKNELDFIYDYTYDEEGRLLHTWRYDADGTLSFHTENVYDEDGHKIAENSYDTGTGEISGTYYANWSNDFHTRTNDWISGGVDKGDDVWTYDDEGNPLMYEYIDTDGVLQNKRVYTYFDSENK